MVARGLSFQSTRSRYSCIRLWVVRWSPCALGTRTRTLCSLLYVVDNLSCGVRSWHAFEKEPRAVLDRSSTLLNPAFFKIVMPFSWPLHLSSTDSWLVHQGPTQLAQCLHAIPQSSQFVFCTVALPDRPSCLCPAHLRRDEHWRGFLSIFSAHVIETFWLCNDFANRDQKSLLIKPYLWFSELI